jgi:hypothetical protein
MKLYVKIFLLLPLLLILVLNAVASMKPDGLSSTLQKNSSIEAKADENFTADNIVLKNKRVEMAYNWLRCQQEKRTKLVRSNSVSGDSRSWVYDPDIDFDNTGWTYDQALAIIIFVIVGDIDAATDCADAMLKVRDKEYNAWSDGYNVCTAKVEAPPLAVGPNAWMGLALLRLYEVTKEHKYLLAADNIGEFILALQSNKGRTKGSVPGGYDKHKNKFTWTSTEHNVDSVAFLVALAEKTGKQKYREASKSIIEWLNKEMWNNKDYYYHPGYEDNDSNDPEKSHFPELLDSQTWTILALLSTADRLDEPVKITGFLHNGLPWIDHFQCPVHFGNKLLHGFQKVTNGDYATPSFWPEGTAGYVLAARYMEHNNPDLEIMLASLQSLQQPDGSLPYSVGISFPDVIQQFEACDLVIADFEAHPNRLWGTVGVYGDGEPDWISIEAKAFDEPYSWYYEPDKPGYYKSNVHSGRQSFRLVNAGEMCKYKRRGWASLGLDFGPITDCKSVKSIDVTDYSKLSFWAKADNPRGAKIKVYLRDTHKRSYEAEATPEPLQITNEWNQYIVELDNISPIVELRRLTHVALAFGENVGNEPNTIIYVDDIAFIGSDKITEISNGAEMPAVFPQHWPLSSVSGTAWFIFAELNVNPYGEKNEHRLESVRKYLPCIGKDNCGQYSLPCSVFSDWLAFSANLDASYKKTQLYSGNDNAKNFTWDTRVDLWLPPFRDEFSWGPYVRLSGITSNKNYEWANNWGALPCYGFQIYPISSRELKEKSEIYNNLSKILGPLHLFIEQNEIRYRGKENSWRPDELVRIGTDYWKEWNVDDIRKSWWAENWNGLIWHSTCGFDNDYDSLIFANSLRFGVRKPNASLVSMFSPYFLAESSLSENEKYAWENRLLLGSGVRFAPPLKLLPPELNMTRFVIYAEYLCPAVYYRDSAPASTPDHDFRVGINVYIGEWWPK